MSDSFDAFFHEVGSEVEEETEALVAEFEISEELFVMNFGELLHGFEFEDDFAFHDDVCAKAFIKPQSVVILEGPAQVVP